MKKKLLALLLICAMLLTGCGSKQASSWDACFYV